MRKYALLTIIIIAQACSPKEDITSLKKELDTKKTEMADLKTEMDSIVKKIEKLDTNVVIELATPVRVQEINPSSFEHYINVTGTVSSKENVLVSAEASGRVEKIMVNEGERVKANQVLIVLDNDIIKNQLDEVKVALELAKITFEKRQKLWNDKIGSEIEYLQSKSTFERTQNQYMSLQKQYDNTSIKTPIAGYVDQINLNKGELVNAGTAITRVVDLSTIEISADLSEEYLTNVGKGDSVLISIPALDYKEKAKITFVSQVINPANRSFTIKVNIKNEENLIKPNLLANIMIKDYSNESAIVVPAIAVQRDLKGDFVFITKEENGETLSTKARVTLGKVSADLVEITSGLSQGDKVVTTGFNLLNEGAVIRTL